MIAHYCKILGVACRDMDRNVSFFKRREFFSMRLCSDLFLSRPLNFVLGTKRLGSNEDSQRFQRSKNCSNIKFTSKHLFPDFSFLRIFLCCKIGFVVSNCRKSGFQVLFLSLFVFGSVKMMNFCIIFFSNFQRGSCFLSAL